MTILIGILIITAITDLCCCKIPNFCIAAGMTGGLIMTFASYSFGGLWQAIVQVIAVFCVFYPLYMIGGLGAGDVKLFMMISCWVRRDRLISCLLVIMLIAGMISAAKMILFRESRERLYYLGRYIKKAALTGTFDEYMTCTADKKSIIRLSVPTLAGVALMYLGVY